MAVAAGPNLEARAREARYAAIASVLDAGAVLLTAHHRDDQTETLLLQLMRGAGPAGLAAMPACTRRGGYWHLRPLLGLPRDVLKRYPDGTTTVWVVDGSGEDAKAFERKVRIGRAIAETVDIVDGLEPDARVVLDGNETLQEGQAVRIVDEAVMR